ncbi:hypothetical protein [Bacillus toyonensis]|uniref:hypothetical protein n=1 Tax=Bacillus toyonensis TaxID=155322 RepID=UPI000BEDCC5A|nr:hypothetical protein [Bacillus toyonensis]PDY85981.1 hypothetical protein CON67_26335 [Bacillus toyonensis]
MSSCDYTVCNSVLSVGPDTIIFDESKNLRWNVLEWLKNTSYSEIQQRKANGLKFGFTIPIEGVPTPFDLDSNFSKEDYNMLQEVTESGRILYFSDNTLTHFVSKIYNPERYQTWLGCIQEISRTCHGLQTNTEYNGNEIIITIKFITDNRDEAFPKVENFYVPPNATCNTGCLSSGDRIGNEHIILITRNNDEQGTLIIDTDKGGISIKLKPPEPPPKEIVISESEKREAIKKTYDYVLNKWIAANGDLGPGGIIRIEEFEVDKSKITFKIVFHYVWRNLFHQAGNGYMEDTIDLTDLDVLNDKDAYVEIRPQFWENTAIVISIYIPLRELAEEILSVVN